MATQLTSFSKFLLTVGIISLLALLVYKVILPKTGINNSNTTLNNTNNTNKGFFDNLTQKTTSNDANTIKVCVVTWGGYAGGQYFNNGFKANSESRFLKEYGFNVEFKVLDDFVASREAWKAGEVDLLWATIDAFPTEVANLKEFEPQVVFQADWSRGGDAIVAQRGINTVADLKEKKIAVAPMTPSHTFLLWMLEAGNLKPSDVTIVEAPNAIDAAAYFKAGKVDAAVVWSPDDEDCVNSVKGSKVLKSTKSASNIIADVFIAKKQWIDKNPEKVEKLVEGWMRGAAEINNNDLNKRKAAKILAEGLNMPEDYCYKAINNVRICTKGDNINFFNLNGNFSGVKGEDLYNKMAITYNKMGFAPATVPQWRQIAYTNAIRNINLTGAEHESEKQATFASPTKADETAPAFSSKPVTITFPSGSYVLDENAKRIIDLEFADIAKAFGNSRIRIEGNTDNVGNPENNKQLSLKRANSVAQYLEKEYNLSPNKFVIVGNGSNKPILDNNTEQGRAKNRRTEFQILADS